MIRNVQASDRAQWDGLWRGYQDFYKVSLPEAVTETAWARFFDAGEAVYCQVAEEDGVLLGFVQYLFHRHTWTIQNVCYLVDLFTVPAARGKGVGRGLIEAVYDAAKAANAPRVYWMTQESNAQAMVLYDKVAEKSGFLQYRKQM
jgi:GNAT superfamily N-acetyltransferase